LAVSAGFLFAQDDDVGFAVVVEGDVVVVEAEASERK
jgi:hypothetical protein